MYTWLSVCQCVCVCSYLILSLDSLTDTCLTNRVELQGPQQLSRVTLITVKCTDPLHPLKNTLVTQLNEFDSN